MVFIKNYSDLNDIKIVMEDEKESVTVSLECGEERVPLVKSDIMQVKETIKKSIKYISDITGKSESKFEGAKKVTSTNILDNKPSEITFFAKGAKTVITGLDELPNKITYFDSTSNKKYPRDMVVMVVPNNVEVPNSSEKKKARHSLVADRRNLGAKTLYVPLKDYTVIVAYIKWPIWSNLKYPAYFYIESSFGKDMAVITNAFKLGVSTNKNISKNKIFDVDPAEAVSYLDETFKKLKERDEKMVNNNRNFNARYKSSANKENRDNKLARKNNNQSGYKSGYNKKSSYKSDGHNKSTNKKFRNTRNYK